MPANYYKSGLWNVICDSCGFKKKSNEVRRRWDGLYVCADTCWETDHPQKFLRVQEGVIAPPFVRTDPDPTYIPVCYIYESASYADLASADCGRADIATPSYAFLLQLKIDNGPAA